MKKIMLLGVLILTLFLVASCAPAPKEGEEVEIELEEEKAIAGQAIRGKITYQSCVDSDGGLKPYVPGIIYLEYTQNGIPKKVDYPDSYLPKEILGSEKGCKSYTPGTILSPLTSKKFKCQNGYGSTSIVSELTGQTNTVFYCKCASDAECPAEYTCLNPEQDYAGDDAGLCSKKAAPVNQTSYPTNSTNQTKNTTAVNKTNQISTFCTDGDNGLDYSAKSTCKDASGTYEDKCYSPTGITEYQCGYNQCGAVGTNCKGGKVCQNGACVSQTPSPTNSTNQTKNTTNSS